MNSKLKLTEEIAADIRTRIKALDFTTVEKVRKAKEENGSFDVIISTEVIDRAGEIVRQDGWDLANYKNNPIVLWGHDYYSLPIGVCIETYETTYRGVPALGARGVFLSADINPLAQQVRRMYEYGVKSGFNVGCTTSVGFIPKEFDPENGTIITKAELLEFSFVPIPANQGVGPASGRALTFDEARELGLDVVGMRQKGVDFAQIRGFIPKDASETKAPEDTVWQKPTLKDFTEKAWEDLTDDEKGEIAKHFAYAKDATAAAFEDLKLPYRRASDGAAVLKGLQAAMSALMGSRGGVEAESDRKAVYEHLAAHYKLFGKEAPAFKTLKEAQPGDSCTTDDGSPGVLTSDPKDPDGALVCLPQEQDKGAKDEHGSQKKLLKALSDEHERHGGEVEKAFDEFQKAVVEDQGDPVDANEGKKTKAEKPEVMRECLKDLRSALADEHTMHRAKDIACLRSFDPAEEKAFDKNPHLKALREEHDAYEQKNNKNLDEFEERMVKSVQGEPEESDEHTDWITGKMEDSQRAHKKAVTKIAKVMCKEAFGEEEHADEKTLEILKEYLAPHIDPLLLTALTAKIGARISADTNKKLGEAHQLLKAAKAVLEDLHKGLADGSGEEGRSNDAKGIDDGPREPRSRPRSSSRSEDPALKAHLQAREIVGGIEAVAREALGKLNADIRSHSKK
jgi:hypothetical protein